MMKAASEWKATCVRCLFSGLMLQNSRRGMKASLARDKTKVMRDPDLEEPGHLVSPARERPSRSHRLKIKNPPTGTKYFCQPWTVDTEKKVQIFGWSLGPHLVTACCYGQTEPGGEDGESDQEVEEGRQVEEPGPADHFSEVDLLGGV